MKKTLIALAAVALTSTAFAQASLSGYVSFGVDTQTGAANTVGFNDTTLTLDVSEDLGGGLSISAQVNLEASTTTRAGALAFADRSVTLSGGFGSVELANTETSSKAVEAGVFESNLSVTSWARTTDDGIEYTGSGVSAKLTIQKLEYTTPEIIPGLTLNAGIAIFDKPEFAGPGQDLTLLENQKGRMTSVGLTYEQGPLTAEVAIAMPNKALRDFVNAKASVTEIKATYDLGVALVGVGYGTATIQGGKHLMVLGVNAPVADALTVGLNYGVRGKARYSELGATYALSKRTNITAHTGQFRPDPTFSTTTTTQSRIALNHAF